MTKQHGRRLRNSAGKPLLRRYARTRSRRARLFEPLEDRLLLAFTVTHTGDAGSGSLREAILLANAQPGLDTIDFNLPGSGPQTIAPTSALPAIVDPIILDGFSQPGSSPNTNPTGAGSNANLQVQLNFSAAGTAIGLFFDVGSQGSTVQGLVINGTSGNPAIMAFSGGHSIRGNYVGTDVTGTSIIGQNGIHLFTSNNTIGGMNPVDRNVIASQFTPAITIQDNAGTVTGNVVQGNLIGMRGDGIAELALNHSGILVLRADDTTIGGGVPAAGNVIFGASGGIKLQDVTNQLVQHNYVGLSAAGTSPLTFSAGPAVAMAGVDDSRIIANVLARSAAGIQLGSASGEPTGSDNNILQGNKIGADATGMLAGFGNSRGIHVTFTNPNFPSTGNLIGGESAGQGNLISGNAEGVRISSWGNTLAGNTVGLASDGTTPLANTVLGVAVFGNDNVIGGLAAGSGNVIAFNRGDGLTIEGGVGNVIVGNSIFNNNEPGFEASSLGIDLLGGNGVNPNDPGDADLGANNLQNFPVITSAQTGSTRTTIEGTLHSLANTTFRIELFANLALDPSGHGEGQRFLGAVQTASDSSGEATFLFQSSALVPVGQFVTATATRLDGVGGLVETSEFSAGIPVSVQPCFKSVTIDVGGNLAFDDGCDTDDVLTVQSDPAAGRLSIRESGNPLTTNIPGAIQPDPMTVLVPIAALTGSTILVNTRGGDDELIVDYDAGNFTRSIAYDGGSQATSDQLRLRGGGTFATVTHTFLSPSSGTIEVHNNGAIAYAGLEPVMDELAATDRRMKFSGGDETIVLSDNGFDDGFSRIDSTLAEVTTFRNPLRTMRVETTTGVGSGTDTVLIEGLDREFNADLAIEGGTDDFVSFQNHATDLGAGNLRVTARTISSSVALKTSQDGTISLQADRNVLFTAGAGAFTDRGAISFAANVSGNVVAENFSAIDLSGTSIQTVSGSVSLTGRGGNAAASNRGVLIRDGSQLVSTGAGLAVGEITITGTGGLGQLFNDGVEVSGAGTRIISDSGPILIAGIGGSNGSSTSTDNNGIRVENGALIASTGTGAAAATITLRGTGGAGESTNRGIRVRLAEIQSIDGAVEINGTGNGTSTGGGIRGVVISQSVIRSSGRGAFAAPITILGNAGPGDDSNQGVVVDNGSLITTVDGNLQLTGTGNSNGSDDSRDNRGVEIRGSQITSTGTEAAAGTISIIGTGGPGDDFNDGVQLAGGSYITSVSGAILVTGSGGSNGTPGSFENRGLHLQAGTLISSTGVGAHAATIQLMGTGGAGGSVNQGVLFVNSRLQSVDGEIQITGTGGGNPPPDDMSTVGSNTGVAIDAQSVLTSSGSGIHAAPIAITGRGGAGEYLETGVEVYGTVTTVDGAITLTGTGGTSNGANSFWNDGARVLGVIRSSGVGPQASTISIDGIAGDSRSGGNVGLRVSGIIETVDADVSLQGTGRNDQGGSLGWGIHVLDGAIRSKGVGSDAGNISLLGIGGRGKDQNFGVQLFHGTNITSVDGNIRIEGIGGSNGVIGAADNDGVRSEDGAQISSTGVGPSAGTITILGTGGPGEVANRGVRLRQSRIHSIDGAVQINGTGGGNGSATSGGNRGAVINSSTIASTGTGSFAAAVTIVGGAGAGDDSNQGIVIESNSSIITIDGDVQLTGSGGSTGGVESNDNRGIQISSSEILSTGTGVEAGSITLAGTGGAGEDRNAGVEIYSLTSQVRSVDGAIRVLGTGRSRASSTADENNGIVVRDGAIVASSGQASIALHGLSSGYGSSNRGVLIDSGGVVASTGTGPTAGPITITGTGGPGEDYNQGVALLNSTSAVSSVSGAITLDGTGGSNGSTTSNGNEGIEVFRSKIESLGTGANAATITLNGHGGNGDDFNSGIVLFSAASVVTKDGDVSLTGVGGQATHGGFHDGIFVGGDFLGRSLVASTGTGTDAGRISLLGLAGTQSGATAHRGVFFRDADASSIDGPIEIVGVGGGNAFAVGTANRGLYLLDSTVQSTGAGTSAATISLAGTGGTGESDNDGVTLEGGLFGTGTQVSAISGDIRIEGDGGSNGSLTSTGNNGVRIVGGAQVSSSGGGTEAATITILGRAGEGNEFNHGVLVRESGSAISSVDGDIQIEGTGNSNQSAQSSLNIGVYLSDGALIASTGVGPEAANISVTGSGGPGQQSNDGIRFGVPGAVAARVTTIDGDIRLHGTGGATPNDPVADLNAGVYATAGSQLISSGVGSEAGAIIIRGTGAGTNSDGIVLAAATSVQAVDGFIELVGTATPTGLSHNAVLLNSSSSVYSTNGSIHMTAMDTPALFDRLVIEPGSQVRSDSGEIMLHAGDDLTVHAGAVLSSISGQVALQTDFTDADVGLGSTVTVRGDLRSVQPVRVLGGDDTDTFVIQPSQAASLFVDGGSPMLGARQTPTGIPAGPGDTLQFDPLGNTFTLAGDTFLTDGGAPAPFLPVQFVNIETVPIDGDLDGVPDFIENGAPNQGDGNGDGIQDAKQSNVASFRSGQNATYATLSTSVGTKLASVATSATPPAPTPPGVQFPFGFISYRIESIPVGTLTTVVLQLHQTIVPPTSYFKFGPTPTNPIPDWYDLAFDAMTGTGVLVNNGTITLNIRDGGRGDDDLTADGIVIDPGGPVIASGLRVASINGPELAVTSEPVRFVADFTSGENSLVSAAVEWGDGSIEAASVHPTGPEGQITATHAYDQPGEYTIRYRVADESGNHVVVETRIRVAIILLQEDPTQSGKQWLTVGGTNSRDVIRFRLAGRSHAIDVYRNTQRLGRFGQNEISRLRVYAGDGDDLVSVHPRISAGIYVDAGGGDDQVFGSRGNDILLGGAGNDRLYGFAGNDVLAGAEGNDRLFGGPDRDVLIGGFGSDYLQGGDGDDILIAGATYFDNDVSSLELIRTAWNSSEDHDRRVAWLRSGTGPSLDDSGVNLAVSGPNPTVVDDCASDRLQGAQHRDWYFARLEQRELDDILLGQTVGESLDAIPACD